MVDIIIPAVLLLLVGGFSALLLTGSAPDEGKRSAGRYDERQKLSQGRGYMWGFLTVGFFTFAVIAAGAIAGWEILSASEALIFAFILGTAVNAGYCVAHDACIPVGGRGVTVIVCLCLYFLLGLIRGLDSLNEQGPVSGGVLGSCWVWFTVAFACASVLLTLLIRRLLDRRRGE